MKLVDQFVLNKCAVKLTRPVLDDVLARLLFELRDFSRERFGPCVPFLQMCLHFGRRQPRPLRGTSAKNVHELSHIAAAGLAPLECTKATKNLPNRATDSSRSNFSMPTWRLWR